MRILIIGGVAGGASAAARARRLSETAEITIIERGPDVSFANCGLPYHIGGEITERSDLAIQTPESLSKLLNLEVLTRTEAIAIDRISKSVTVRDLETGDESRLSYDKLVLSPGAKPLVPQITGIDFPEVHSLRTLQDMDRIETDLKSAKDVLIIGGGFIGLEMAEQIHHLGCTTTLVERNRQVLTPLDPELAKDLASTFESKGVRLHFSENLISIEQGPTAVFASGLRLKTDLIILSIGVVPENALAEDCGLALGDRGHIRVNEYQQTSDENIYAAGDVVETSDSILGGYRPLALGGPANRQGRTIADHMFRGDEALPYPGSIGTANVRVFETTAALTGYGEEFLRKQDVPFQSVTINAASHADYYPGAETIKLKVLWSPEDGRILGAQAVGRDGVDKRIDVLATAIRGKMTVEDLCHLELCYAPPFGSAKDPVNIAGFAACNLREGLLKPKYGLPDGRAIVVDVRPAAKAKSQPVPGAINIPLPELRSRLGEIDSTQPVFAICQMGKTSYFAARILQQNGFDAHSIIGGAHLNL
ncbi:FAD-dependent oxidoreductase [Luteolibacter sp. AS25]|uniref:FAD-dependent oxidoreductase n=1 Tax=Luteolibacter sp. AS25 TaxID=3135776 RepID=UPI00398B96BC